MRTEAVVVAAGRSTRMGSTRRKQYMDLMGRPVVYYSLKALQDSPVDRIVLVCGEGEEDYCEEQIVRRYGLSKVGSIVAGGPQRYDSVYSGLKCTNCCDYVMIHDGARPLLSQYIIEKCLRSAVKYRASVAAVKASDTVKVEDGNGFIAESPDRSMIWLVQTPQVFEYSLIRNSYDRLMSTMDRLKGAGVAVTDDTMVARMFGSVNAKLVENPDPNIKITRKVDLVLAEALLRTQGQGREDGD